MNIKTILLVTAAVVILVFGVPYYLIQIWGRNPHYSWGVDTPGNLKDVTVFLKPQGSFDFGVGGQKFDENPPWPVPQSVRLEFRDAHNKKFVAEYGTSLPKSFSGQIIVHVEKRPDGYYSFVQATDKENHTSRTSEVLVKSQ